MAVMQYGTVLDDPLTQQLAVVVKGYCQTDAARRALDGVQKDVVSRKALYWGCAENFMGWNGLLLSYALRP